MSAGQKSEMVRVRANTLRHLRLVKMASGLDITEILQHYVAFVQEHEDLFREWTAKRMKGSKASGNPDEP
jgi:hypothetical protein